MIFLYFKHKVHKGWGGKREGDGVKESSEVCQQVCLLNIVLCPDSTLFTKDKNNATVNIGL